MASTLRIDDPLSWLLKKECPDAGASVARLLFSISSCQYKRGVDLLSLPGDFPSAVKPSIAPRRHQSCQACQNKTQRRIETRVPISERGSMHRLEESEGLQIADGPQKKHST